MIVIIFCCDLKFYICSVTLCVYCSYVSYVSGERNLTFDCLNFVVMLSQNVGNCGVWNYCICFLNKKLQNWCLWQYGAHLSVWMRCKQYLIGLDWEPIIRPTSLWNYYTSHTQQAKLLRQWTQRVLCHQLEIKLMIPVDILNCCSNREKEILAKVKAVTLYFGLLRAEKAISRHICMFFFFTVDEDLIGESKWPCKTTTVTSLCLHQCVTG